MKMRNSQGYYIFPHTLCDIFCRIGFIIQLSPKSQWFFNLVLTTPNVVYRVKKRDGEMVEIDNPADLPELNEIASFEEPYIEVKFLYLVSSPEKSSWVKVWIF